jgi:hypothetical protein
MTPRTIDVRHGDCREVVKTLADDSIDSCVTDPPYALVSIVNRFGKTKVGDDTEPTERRLGINAGLAWRGVAEASVVYVDRGISDGMRYGIVAARGAGLEVEFRRLEGPAGAIVDETAS